MNYGTLPSLLLNAVDSLSNPRAQMFRAANGWQSISSEEFLRRVAGLSTAFVELGVKPGDRVGLFAANRPAPLHRSSQRPRLPPTISNRCDLAAQLALAK